MTKQQRKACLSLKGRTFKPDSFDAAFAEDMIYRAENEPGYKLSDKQNVYLWKLYKRFQATGDILGHAQRTESVDCINSAAASQLIVTEGKLRIALETLRYYETTENADKARRALEVIHAERTNT